MQTPGKLNLVAYQGASWDYTLTWLSGGTPIDLTSYTARMQVRETFDSTGSIFSITSGTGITLGGTAGTIYLEASASTTAGWDGTPNKQYIYDLELENAGVVTRLVEGTFTVNPEVTR